MMIPFIPIRDPVSSTDVCRWTVPDETPAQQAQDALASVGWLRTTGSSWPGAALYHVPKLGSSPAVLNHSRIASGAVVIAYRPHIAAALT
jgi:hypothetical protein